MASKREQVERVLREHGLRSTVQRRVILAVVQDALGEHLSADEVHSRAIQALPSLARGTVYATLTELTELGAVGAVGLPEPVRYEANTDPHGHFRCRLCARLFDLQGEVIELVDLLEGFAVERVNARAEGECADCSRYRDGLLGGIAAIAGQGRSPWLAPLEQPGLASARAEGPLGDIVLAATAVGLVRLAFEGQSDYEQLRERSRGTRGSHGARGHLKRTKDALGQLLAGKSETIECEVDLDVLEAGGGALGSTQSIPWDSHRSYLELDLEMDAREIGMWMGANPMPIVFPCHRVSRGKEVPVDFVAGSERRGWLEGLEHVGL
ncbi:MAG TPA: transcriptional repressor [Solirubrobacteraceae bacterium]|nr:transcriptional repressor [Solirubrobacteraceae bacterium]